MNLVPRMAAMAFMSLALVGLAETASAGGISPGNGGSMVLPSVLPPSVRDTLLLSSGSSSSEALGQKFGLQNGQLDFFSLHPTDGGAFKPLLRGGFGDGGLQLQLKW